MSRQLPPFSCIYSPNIPELLNGLNCSIALSTYQAGKLVFISPANDEKLIQLPRNFDKAMGFCFSGKQMALATKDKIHVLANSPELAKSYPRQKNLYDAFFMPRVSYFTGQVDIHDVHLGEKDVYAVNTSFSCIVKTSDEYSWEPIWSPSHIDSYASEDRCHLNGLIVDSEEKLRYATSLGTGNTLQSWRKTIPEGGVLYDIQQNKIILKDLHMPHSPRMHRGDVYFLESAKGLICKYNIETGKVSEIKQLDAFTRGLAIYDDYLFVGKSKLRPNSSIFDRLEIAKSKIEPGITIIHLPTKSIVGEIHYQNSVDEIYDVQILPGYIRPNILNPENELSNLALSIPTSTYWAKLN